MFFRVRKSFFHIVRLLVLIIVFSSLLNPVIQAEPLGGEFRVNTFTSQSQSYPDIASNASGDFVVVWNGQGQNGRGIIAQRYDSAGVPQGGEIMVNSVPDSGGSASIAMHSSGSFVVAWNDFNQDSELTDIRARRFDASGMPLGDEFAVNTYTNSYQEEADVAIDEQGNFVIVWESANHTIVGGDFEVYGRRYDADGNPLGGEFPVNSTPTGLAPYLTLSPQIAMRTGGSFVVVWRHQETSPSDIYARLFANDATPLTSEFMVNEINTTYDVGHNVAMDKDSGNFVIGWDSEVAANDYEVFARRFNASGIQQDSEIQVTNAPTEFTEFSGGIAIDVNGNFIFTWSRGVFGVSGSEIFAQIYNVSGVPQGSEFQVNSYSTGVQRNPVVAMHSLDEFVFAWRGEGLTDNEGVFARRYGILIIPPITISEQQFYAEFNEQIVDYPEIAQGLADFIPGGINITIRTSSGIVGTVNLSFEQGNGVVIIGIDNITVTSGSATDLQTFSDIINRNLLQLVAATLNGLLVSMFGPDHNVETIVITDSTMEIALTSP